jgi:hypothetical protein
MPVRPGPGSLRPSRRRLEFKLIAPARRRPASGSLPVRPRPGLTGSLQCCQAGLAGRLGLRRECARSHQAAELRSHSLPQPASVSPSRCWQALKRRPQNHLHHHRDYSRLPAPPARPGRVDGGHHRDQALLLSQVRPVVTCSQSPDWQSLRSGLIPGANVVQLMSTAVDQLLTKT